MINTILATKVNNSQVFVDGVRVPVTTMKGSTLVVTQVKSMAKDGYHALQLGFLTKKSKNTSKPLQGHLKQTQISNSDLKSLPKYLQEVRLEKEIENLKVGDQINLVDVIKEGDIVNVVGVSKGKGFAGGVKRHGFRGGPRTHGQSDRERAPGSIGQTTTPGRVYRGKRMAGRMGGTQVTIKNLKVIKVNLETGEIQVQGQVPGSPGTILTVNKVNA